MIILPAIDIKDGNCVRLFKGDFSTVEKVAADHMETAKGFEAAGASWIHMVDLDGAKEGRPVNQHIYEDVAARARASKGEISDAVEKVCGRHKAIIRSISGVYSSEFSDDD